MPPRSTKAPKLTTDDTTPLRTSPGLRLARKSSRCSFCVSSRQARRDSTTLLRFLSSSMILACSDAADVRLQVAHPAQLDERGGQEAAQADVDDEAALDDLDDRALDDAVRFLDLLDRAPRPLVLRPLLGQDEAALLVLLRRTRASIFSPSDTISCGSTSLRIDSSRAGMTPSDL